MTSGHCRGARRCPREKYLAIHPHLPHFRRHRSRRGVAVIDIDVELKVVIDRTVDRPTRRLMYTTDGRRIEFQASSIEDLKSTLTKLVDCGVAKVTGTE